MEPTMAAGDDSASRRRAGGASRRAGASRSLSRLAPSRVLALLAVSMLATAILWPHAGCPVRLAEGAGLLSWLLTGITQTVAGTLGLVDGTVTTVTGLVVDVTALLSAPTQCSGQLCIDMQLAGKNHPDMASVNARVLLWSPKVANTTAGDEYDPRTKDWASVIATCRAMFKHEKRLASFFIRASFHDSMAVDVRNCPGPDCGGADSSLLLTIDELTRPENAYDNFSLLTARAAKKIASFFDVSVADTLAVCAAVAPEVLSNGRIRTLPANGTRVLPVGRLDSISPAPPNQLPPASAGVDEFVQFWAARGINAKEAMALMGSHALIDTQGCFRGPKDVCDPTTEDCSNVRMFRWENHYFKDLCSPTLEVSTSPADPLDAPAPLMDTPILGMTDDELDAEARLQTCSFTSKEARVMALNRLRLTQAGLVPEDPDMRDAVDVIWSNRNCTGGTAYRVPASHCPHFPSWPYTGNDALLGRACQGHGDSAAHRAVRGAAREYLASQNIWDNHYRTAYIKMVSTFARFSPRAVNISGHECVSRTYLESACAQAGAGPATQDTKDLYAGQYDGLLFSSLLSDGTCKACSQAAPPSSSCSRSQCSQCIDTFVSSRTFRGLTPNTSLLNTPNCCVCSTTLREYLYNATSQQVMHMPFMVRFPDLLPSVLMVPAEPLPAVGQVPVPERPLEPAPVDDDASPDVTSNGVLRDPPVTPYHSDPSRVCPREHGTVVKVEGFPSSPFRWTPFTRPFAKPPKAQKANSYCRNGTNLCLDAYEFDIFPTKADLGCPNGTTWILSYNGTSPGPTIRAPVGRQTLVRFNNRLTNATIAGTPFYPFTPCDTTPGRQGRPISVHLHGEASLAPYDGWAEDSTCGGESKDYYYPNRRAAYGWYHDHQLEITAENAYYGLSGMYIFTDNKAEGGCGEPWNLDGLPDTEMQFKDAVLDHSCQLLYDRSGPHRDNLYGDVNFVNGIPWPVITFEPRWQRFRWLNAAPTRPFKLRLIDAANGSDVGGTACRVIAGDGGLRRTPARFPSAGLFMGVAERYEVVCDLAPYAGRTLLLWNAYDKRRMKAVPFFCHSHLVAKIRVAATVGGAVASPAVFRAERPARAVLDAVLSNDTDIPRALAMARNKTCTRTFRFGRRHGHWVINGETWHTARVAAGNVGHNTWEVWCLETGGGWYHPIHIHLVDFYVLARNHLVEEVHEYERWTPKDVVQLDPSSQVSLLIRFGPHRGEYMFHCHNLVHEDFEMMRSFRVVHTGAGRMNSTALPMQSQPKLIESLNVIYDLYDDPVNTKFSARPTSGLTPLRLLSNASSSVNPLSFGINNGIYRIFYPGGASNESALLYNAINPWLVSLPTTSRCPAPTPAAGAT
ncbi:hypothetical protein PLESTF_000100100 [Pleodorina starrii]|nr:hypothetical protein PLESTF_000100100 [Pleodorina starrii]